MLHPAGGWHHRLSEREWAPAREEASFTTSTLRLTIDDPRYKEVKVELGLVYKLAEWGVTIDIYSKKPDDEPGVKITGVQ